MPSLSTNNSTTPGGGSGGGGSAIHGPLPTIGSVTMSMVSSATTSMVGPYTLYTGGVATPTVRVSGVNVGNRIRLYVWSATGGGPYLCTTVSAEQTAAATSEDLILSPALTNGYWIVVPVLDDGSGTNTGCPAITDITGQLVPFVYYNLTIVATAPTSMTLVSPATSTSYNTRPTVQVGGLTSGDTVAVYSDASCTTSVGSTTATGATADVTLTTSLSPGAATLYAKRTTSGGTASGCSTVSLSYTVQAPTGGLPSLAGVALSMNGVGAPANYGGGLFVYSGTVAKPSLGITGVNVGNRIKIYQWEGSGPYTCTNLVAESGADATSVTIQVTTAATGTVVYVPVIDDGSGSDTGCPDVNTFPAFPYVYYMYTPPVSTPTSLTLISPSYNPGRLSSPVVGIAGVSNGDTVSLYSDSSCLNQVGTGTATSTTIDLTTSSALSGDGTYNFYAKRVSSGVSSACSTATLQYVLNSNVPTPSGLSLTNPTSSPGVNKTPTITVAGVVAGDTINLYTDNTCSGAVVAQTVSSSTTADLTVSSPLTDGSYTFYSRAVNGALQSGCSTASVTYVVDSYYAKVTAIAMVTPATNSGASSTPTVRISGVLSGDLVSLYKTNDCSGSTVGTATASGTTVDITTSSLGGIGAYSLYAIRSNGGKISDCSVASITYSVDIPPSGLSLYSPTTSPSQTVNPYILISGVVSGDTVSLFTDSSCTTQVATGTASGTTLYLQSSVLSDGTYQFYANRTKSGFTTSCSSAHVQYIVDTVIAPPVVSGIWGSGTSVVTGDLPQVGVTSVDSGDTINIYTDSNCSTQVASGTSSGTTANISFSTPIADGYTYTFYAKRTNGYLHSNCSTTSTQYSLDTTVTVSFSKLYSIDSEANTSKTVSVTLSRAKPYATTIYFHNAGSTASAGVDYNIASSSVTIPANQTSASISYDLLTDGVADGEKSLYFSLTHTSKSAVVLGALTQFRQYIIDAQATSDPVISLSNNCVVTSSGKLKCWGANNFASVGDGTNTNRTSPVWIDTSTTYLSVASRYLSNCGITSAHVLKCWGYGGSYVLGNGGAMDLSTPTVIDAGTQYSFVSPGTVVSCGVTITGDLKCWGTGATNIVNSSTPVVIDSGETYSKVSTASSHACAITTAGVLKCWGDNSNGQLGDGTATTRTTPTVIDSGVTYIDVSVGSFETCAITSANVLKCWGYGGGWASGTSGLAWPAWPYNIPTVKDSGVTYSKIDVDFNYGNACGVTTAGQLKCWGKNQSDAFGGVGIGSAGTSLLSPVVIDSSNTYTDVVGTCAIKTSGYLICWSSAHNFIFGNFSFGYQNQSTAKTILSNNSYSKVSLFSTGWVGRGCAIDTNGKINCWGFGYNGDGSDTTQNRFYPVRVDDSITYSKISTGWKHTCAITTVGVVRCWGDNSGYQLGTWSIGSSNVSVVVDSGTTYTDIASGSEFSCGITSAGEQKCWGRLPIYSWVGTPTVYDSGTLYTKMSLGNQTVCGLTNTGNIKCWGYLLTGWASTPVTIDSGTSYTDVSVDYYGKVCGIQAATGELRCFYNYNYASATVIDSGTSFSRVSIGSGIDCAITSAGVLRCWDQTTLAVATIDAGTLYSEVSASNGSQCAITNAGEAKCWGENRGFHLGLGYNFMFPFNRSAGLETQ